MRVERRARYPSNGPLLPDRPVPSPSRLSHATRPPRREEPPEHFGYGNKLCCHLLKPQGCAQFFEEDLSQCSGLAIDTGNAGKWRVGMYEGWHVRALACTGKRGWQYREREAQRTTVPERPTDLSEVISTRWLPMERRPLHNPRTADVTYSERGSGVSDTVGQIRGDSL